MKRILVFTTNWLGDALFLSPFLAALKENFPHSHLAILLVPRVKEIFQNNPNVDEIIIYPVRNRNSNGVYDREKRINLFSYLDFIFKLRKKGFDTAIIVRPSRTRTLLLRFSGIRQIIGFDNPKSGWLLTVKVPTPSKLLHKIDYFLTILEHLDIKLSQRRYEFFLTDKDRVYIERLFSKKMIAQDLPLVVINPGANWYPKRWPPENFAELIKRIKQRLPLNIAITGAGKDKDLTKGIIEQSGNEVFDFTGQTTLGQLGALMQEADIVISADSGPMHIAAAVGTKLIALFGPTSALITGPYPLGAHIIIQKEVGCKVPCYDSSCTNYRCMKTITVDEVLEKLTGLLMLK